MCFDEKDNQDECVLTEGPNGGSAPESVQGRNFRGGTSDASIPLFHG
jgi:hypothetical protein